MGDGGDGILGSSCRRTWWSAPWSFRHLERRRRDGADRTGVRVSRSEDQRRW